jgi:hypothetical protein
MLQYWACTVALPGQMFGFSLERIGGIALARALGMPSGAEGLIPKSMQLRDCPLMSHRGTRNWPPTWNKTGGGSLAGAYETLRGEIGTLEKVLLSKSEPYNTCYLLIEFRHMTYVGTLIFDDAMFCRQLCELLQNHHLGKSIKEIGDLEAGRFL